MHNIFPTESGAVIPEEEKQQIKFGVGWQFDFSSGEFIQTPTGQIARADKLQAYIQWCEKALRTPRYRYLIYDRYYGGDFEDLIGKGLPRAVIESEIKRITTETLKVDPRTGDVQNFVFSWQDDGVYFTCDVYTVNSEMANVGLKVVV